MKYLFLVLLCSVELFSSVLKAPIVSINEESTQATVQIDRVQVGMTGFVVHDISDGRTDILANAVVTSFNKDTGIATIKLDEFNALANNALPSGKWKIKVGDTAILAFGYTRGVLLAPNEEIYHRITKSAKIQWVHPDLFATLLSFNGHPTPQREDFTQMSIDNSVGLLYIFLDNRVFTLDAKSFAILAITETKLEIGKRQMPFYTRVPEIDANWFGAGSWELDEDDPHYYELMIEANPKNRELYNIIKSLGEDFEDLLDDFLIDNK